MLETICPNCRQRYPLGQDHTCPKKSTAAPTPNSQLPVDTKLGRPRDQGPSQGKSKRAAQMRDYMRIRRAKIKAGK